MRYVQKEEVPKMRRISESSEVGEKVEGSKVEIKIEELEDLKHDKITEDIPEREDEEMIEEIQ